jgi:hypothetical protein
VPLVGLNTPVSTEISVVLPASPTDPETNRGTVTYTEAQAARVHMSVCAGVCGGMQTGPVGAQQPKALVLINAERKVVQCHLGRLAQATLERRGGGPPPV